MSQRLITPFLWAARDGSCTGEAFLLPRGSILGPETKFTRFNSCLKLKGDVMNGGENAEHQRSPGPWLVSATPARGGCHARQSHQSVIPSWSCPEKILHPSCVLYELCCMLTDTVWIFFLRWVMVCFLRSWKPTVKEREQGGAACHAGGYRGGQGDRLASLLLPFLDFL